MHWIDLIAIVLCVISLIFILINYSAIWVVLFVATIIYFAIRFAYVMGFDFDFMD